MDIFTNVSEKISKLAKPLGSLGNLEYYAAKIAQIQQTETPSITKSRITVFAGDHGVARQEKVSAYPPSVTALMVKTFKTGKAAINQIAEANGVDLEVMNCGVEGLNQDETLKPTGVSCYYEAATDGPTQNLKTDSAMTTQQLESCMTAGRNAARRAQQDNVSIAGAGEMGIGNTTSATAIFAQTLGLNPNEITGPGAGLDEKGIMEKMAVIQEALIRTKNVRDPLEILRELGGFEIAAMTGYFLELTRAGIPILLDGFITTSAALIAMRIDPKVGDNLIVSTVSGEPAHRLILAKMNLHNPVFDMSLRLGEGTGACLAVPVMRSACNILNGMATLDDVLQGNLK